MSKLVESDTYLKRPAAAVSAIAGSVLYWLDLIVWLLFTQHGENLHMVNYFVQAYQVKSQ